MWIARWIVGTLLVLLVIGFAIQNTETDVVIKFYKWQSIALPLWVVMYLSFAAGVLTWLMVSIVRILMLKQEMRKFKKENKRLREELNRLRNVSIEEETSEDQDKLGSVPIKDLEKPFDEGEKDMEGVL